MQPSLEMELPASFSCPISHEVMRDPVTLSDGHSYERRSIERWLEKKTTSPLTGATLRCAAAGRLARPARRTRTQFARIVLIRCAAPSDVTVVPNHALRNSVSGAAPLMTRLCWRG